MRHPKLFSENPQAPPTVLSVSVSVSVTHIEANQHRTSAGGIASISNTDRAAKKKYKKTEHVNIFHLFSSLYQSSGHFKVDR
jgi:hypothetical protein